MSKEEDVILLSYLSEFLKSEMSKTTTAVNFLQHFDSLRKIFVHGVQSVHPLTLLNDKKNLDICKSSENREILKIRDNTIDLTGKRCHLVGFGKGVLGMAVQLEKILNNRLLSGILSVPVGTIEKFNHVKEMQLFEKSVIKIFEGADNNLPDENAIETTKKIKKLAESMSNDDILFVMITGGGSALLPLPYPTITLEEKLDIIKKLVRKGASIDELNIVRITLSQTKGGKLAESAKGAYRVISFIIADMVSGDIDLIASGPTIQFQGRSINAEGILEKYNLWDGLKENVKDCVKKHQQNDKTEISLLSNNFYYLIGTNKIAVDGCSKIARKLEYIPFILSTKIKGNVTDITVEYIEFLKNLKKYLKKGITENQFKSSFPFDANIFSDFMKTIQKSKDEQKHLCLILSGEPTVNISGNGKGGRNQELALRMSLGLYENFLLDNVYFLSAGTDGIDGPTDVAGAFGSGDIVKEFLKTKTMKECSEYLLRNDSYNFYKYLNNGDFHIKTGHTGTNVMDLHLIIVPTF